MRASPIRLISLVPMTLMMLSMPEGVHALNQSVAPLELSKALEKIQQTDGIQFKVEKSLADDLIQLPLNQRERPNLTQILKGYNWVGVRDISGIWHTVVVTGRNGDGLIGSNDDSSSVPLRYRAPPKQVPKKYQGLPKTAIYPIDLSADMLRKMSLGEKIVLTLPSGDLSLIHDRKWDHSNGESTWVARETTDKGFFRTLLTLGHRDQIEGQIVTSDGVYQVESDETGQWLIDIRASGLQLGTFDQGGMPPVIPAVATNAIGSSTANANSAIAGPQFTAATSANEDAQIDLLLLYSDDLQNDNPETRINNLVAFANQALSDSKVHLEFNLLGVRKVTYLHDVTNLVALNQLTAAQDVFNTVPKLRESQGADLILLIRPFHPTSEDSSCGDAWINGSNGSGFSPDLAFGVVNDGRAEGLYCSNYTLAHELGHLLGASHDRSHATNVGHFAYSYGYGIKGVFGDIMSYYSPEVGLFSSPDLSNCNGQKCGVPMGEPGEADVASTLRVTGPVVAHFSARPSR